MKLNRISSDKIRGCKCNYEKLIDGYNCLFEQCRIHKPLESKEEKTVSGVTVNELSLIMQEIAFRSRKKIL